MVIHGGRWGALPWPTWKNLGWAGRHVRTRSLKKATTSLDCLRNLKVNGIIWLFLTILLIVKKKKKKSNFLFLLFQEKPLIQPNHSIMQSPILSAPWCTAADLTTMSQNLHQVDRTNRNMQLLGTPSIQVGFLMFLRLLLCRTAILNWLQNFFFFFLQLYNLFPHFFKWIVNRREYCKSFALTIKKNSELISRLKESQRLCSRLFGPQAKSRGR